MVTAEMDKAWRRVVAKAWADEGYKARLLDDPDGVLRAEGIALPAGKTARIIQPSVGQPSVGQPSAGEAGPGEALFVLPPQPSAQGGPAAEEERISPIISF